MSHIRSERSVYRVLEKYLRQAQYPMTCVDLMDIAEIEQAALVDFGKDKRIATNKVSDTLGQMWRKELLTRFPAVHASGAQMARYAYIWTKREEPGEPAPLPTPSRANKTGISIEEREDGVMIEFDKFFVFIKPK